LLWGAMQEDIQNIRELIPPMSLIPPPHIADDDKKHNRGNACTKPVVLRVVYVLVRVGRDGKLEVLGTPSAHWYIAKAVSIDTDDLHECPDDGREE